MKSDQAWKTLLMSLFPQFVAFFVPEAYAEIDWDAGFVALDNELPAIVGKTGGKAANKHGRLVDKLMRVQLKSGQPLVVFFHVEVQAQPDSNFAERMYVYNYRLYDRHVNPLRKSRKKASLPAKVFSMAILADPNQNWQPEPYQAMLWGSELTFKYPTRKLTDYREKLAPLLYTNFAELVAAADADDVGETGEQLAPEQKAAADQAQQELDARLAEAIGVIQDNPFAVVIAAHLDAMALANNLDLRYRSNKYLVKALLRTKRFPPEVIHATFSTISSLMELPDEMEKKLKVSMSNEVNEAGVPYLTAFEREAMLQGRQEGRQEGREEGLEEGRKTLIDLIRMVLRDRLHVPDSVSYEERLQAASLESLKTWAQRCIFANGVNDIFEH